MKYKVLGLIALLLTTTNAFSEDKLFEQPDNDDTCGIRQILIAKHVLYQNQPPYEGNILPLWKLDYNIFCRDYSDLLSQSPIDPIFTKLMLLDSLPAEYTPQAVSAVNGGPTTMSSSLIKASQQSLGTKCVKVYANKNSILSIVGKTIYNREIKLIEELGIDIIYINSPFTQEKFNNPKSYYVLWINNGEHWIGTTKQFTYDSLKTGPTLYNPNEVEDNFSGLIIEFQRDESAANVDIPAANSEIKTDPSVAPLPAKKQEGTL